MQQKKMYLTLVALILATPTLACNEWEGPTRRVYTANGRWYDKPIRPLYETDGCAGSCGPVKSIAKPAEDKSKAAPKKAGHA